jgi:osmotically-inducible protein OsmY
MRAIREEDSSPQNRSRPYPVDADLERDVRRALSTSEALKSAVITPVSLHREVTLSGTVVDESSRELAEKITSQVSGVVEVYNDLTIEVGVESRDNRTPSQPQPPVKPQ